MKINKQRTPKDNLKSIIEEAKRLDINFAEVTTPRIMRFLPPFLEGKTFNEIAESEDVTFKVVLNALCGEKNSALSYLYTAVQNKYTAPKENEKNLVPKPTTKNKILKRKNQKIDVDIEQKMSTEKKFTSLQMSLISLVDKHKENNLPLETVLSESEMKILNLFLQEKSYTLISEDLGLTASVVYNILIGRNDSISSKLRSNWHQYSLKSMGRDDQITSLSKERVLLELKQCRRELLNDALDNLHLTILRTLFKSVIGLNKNEGNIELSKEEVLLKLKECERRTLNDAFEHLPLTHLKRLYKTVSDWKKVDKKINLSKEEVFLELIQCDRKALDDALDSLHIAHLKKLYKAVKNSKR